jgi:hypothetical protein
MLGVVLWSDASDRKAVIWCEDHGDLAYVRPADPTFDGDEFFDAGDLVQFDVRTQSSLRIAHNTRLVVEKAGSALPDLLCKGVKSNPRPSSRAQVVPFATACERLRKSA